MRNSMVQEALRNLAAESATRFTNLVATGEELPFDVAENDGEHTFYRYVPLTGRFVRDHAAELRALPSFVGACSSVDAAGIAASYLDARGEPVSADEIDRAEQMLIAFIARLWEGSTEFTLDRAKLEAALHELDAESQDVAEAEFLLAPLIGFQMPLLRLDLPGVRIVRADTVEAPAEVTSSDGMQRNSWEPQFLALAEHEQGPQGPSPAPALRLLRELISVLRLFKPGGVGLGPHVFAPTGEQNWRRIATGAAAPRQGGYHLGRDEAPELADFARRLEARPDPGGTLAWAVNRFEIGCDRPTPLDGLSDHLLVMRALFEGEGAVGAALPMRAAALIAEPAQREEARVQLQSAFTLERALMAGRELELADAMVLATWVEDAARKIVSGAALGEHGRDVAASADESLVAAGLDAGEGIGDGIGETIDWELPANGSAGGPAAEGELDMPDPDAIRVRARRPRRPDDQRQEPEPEQRTEPHAANGVHLHSEGGVGGESDEEQPDEQSFQDEPQPDHEESTVGTSTQRDWLSEVTQDDLGETLEWPAPPRENSRRERDLRDDDELEDPLETPRVRHLFPVPDGTDWDIGELDYDRSDTRVS